MNPLGLMIVFAVSLAVVVDHTSSWSITSITGSLVIFNYFLDDQVS